MVGLMHTVQARLHHKKVQSWDWKHHHKYGVKLPQNVEEALEIDH